MREAAGEQQQQEPAPGEAGNSVCAEPAGSGHCSQPWKKFVYVEPPKRVKEVLEEELYFRRDGCQIKHPAAATETMDLGTCLICLWSFKRFMLLLNSHLTCNRKGQKSVLKYDT